MNKTGYEITEGVSWIFKNGEFISIITKKLKENEKILNPNYWICFLRVHNSK